MVGAGGVLESRVCAAAAHPPSRVLQQSVQNPEKNELNRQRVILRLAWLARQALGEKQEGSGVEGMLSPRCGGFAQRRHRHCTGMAATLLVGLLKMMRL